MVERLVRSRIEVQSRERKGGDLSPALYREFINVPLANRNPHLHRIFRLNKHAAPEAWGKLPKNVVIVIQSRTQSSASELRDNSDRPIAALKRFELAHAQVALTLRLGPETTRAVQVQPLTAEQTAFLESLCDRILNWEDKPSDIKIEDHVWHHVRQVWPCNGKEGGKEEDWLSSTVLKEYGIC